MQPQFTNYTNSNAPVPEGTVIIERGSSAQDFAPKLNRTAADVVRYLLEHGEMVTATMSLGDEQMELFALEIGAEILLVDPGQQEEMELQALFDDSDDDDEALQQLRPPVITVMGHVDHGKTSLLDKIRKANVAGGEAGGITQHIGAYKVQTPNHGTIVFLDTPGHEAFSAMRARGAKATDVIVLVVAADDGVMPQTVEAINHAKAANVPIIVAVNKIDKPDATPDRVITQLPEQGVIPEAFGGDTIVCPVSAVTGEGVPNLLEMILLQAGVLQLTADPKGELDGSVIEAKLEKGRGPVATILVQQGTLKVGDAIVVGQTYGRIKAMTDYRGERITEAGPSVPAEILGLNDVPQAGDKIEFATSEREAREIAEERAGVAHRKSLEAPSRGMTLSELRVKLAEGVSKDLNLLVKADVQGSVEAVRGLLEKIENEEVDVHVIHSGVGSVTESDILLASAANAICVGFNVKPEPGAKREAERRKVEIRTYTIIYELIDEVKDAMAGLLPPILKDVVVGSAEVRQLFELSKGGVVAGCAVNTGRIVKGKVRVMRRKNLLYEGVTLSLRRFQDEVNEVRSGLECGIRIDGFNEFQIGDAIECYTLEKVKQAL